MIQYCYKIFSWLKNLKASLKILNPLSPNMVSDTWTVAVPKQSYHLFETGFAAI